MERKATLERPIRFAEFEVDPRAGELRKLGAKIKLQEQPFQVLVMLLERPGEVVTREELHQGIWPADTLVDFENGLNKAINKLRVALGDSAENPRFVETLPRHGYRFTGSIDRVVDYQNPTEDAIPPLLTTSPSSSGLPEAAHVATSPLTNPTSEGRAVPMTKRQPHQRVAAVLVLAATLVALVGLSAGALRYLPFGRPAAGTIRSVAVLPLENLSRDPDQEYFAEGMTEALINDLGKIGELRVISRTSVMRYKGTKKSLQEIARELRVDSLVEGTVARSGDRVRITASLVQASPEKQLWADNFERDLRDVLTLQSDISRAIANGIQIRLTPQERARLANAHSIDPAAYEAYLEGRYFWEKLWPKGGPKARRYFEVAIERDPTWALPYTGLADSYDMVGGNIAMPNEFCRKAKAAALEGVKRDDGIAETHTLLADVEFWCEWDWFGAEREVRRAIELNPSFARARSSHGRYVFAMGRTDEGLAETKRAVELDPLSPRIRWDRWLLLYLVGQYDGAAEQCRKMQEIDPQYDLGHLYCGNVDVEKGNLAQGIREIQEAVTLSEGTNANALAHLGYAYARAGRRNDAQNVIAQLKERSKHAYMPPVYMAVVYAGLGQKQEAFEWLERGYRVHSRDLLELKYYPQFATLRSDPRFADLVRRVGLPH